jgi:hypothetical protein
MIRINVIFQNDSLIKQLLFYNLHFRDIIGSAFVTAPVTIAIISVEPVYKTQVLLPVVFYVLTAISIVKF